MSERIPYEPFENEMEGMPVPNQEEAWQKMKQKLDEDERGRRFPPIVLLRSCAGWGLLLSLLVAGTWLILKPGKQDKVNTEQGTVRQTENIKPAQNLPQGESKDIVVQQRQNFELGSGSQATETAGLKNNISVKDKSNGIARTLTAKTSDQINFTKKKVDLIVVNDDLPANQNQTEHAEAKTGDDTYRGINEIATRKKEEIERISDSLKENKTRDTAAKKVLVQITADTAVKKENKAGVVAKKYFMSAGVGLQQQIPLAGQISAPYNYYGRKGNLYDYIPSVWVRLNRGEKWYVQGEFRFGAPQAVKEFSFSRQSKYDTSLNSVTTITQRLKKTYYHQLPISFNYYLKPGLSIGAGAVYSRFYGAVTEQEVKNTDVTSQNVTTSKSILQIAGFTDSFLYKTQLHLLFQADYQWKGLSIGLRYRKDMQPYIKYTRPNGDVNIEKNQSLEAVLRLRLWQNK